MWVFVLFDVGMLVKRVLGVKVDMQDAECVRLFLKKEGLLLKGFLVKKEAGSVIFPIAGSHRFL